MYSFNTAQRILILRGLDRQMVRLSYKGGVSGGRRRRHHTKSGPGRIHFSGKKESK